MPVACQHHALPARLPDPLASYLHQRATLSAITTMFYLYPGCVTSLLSVFACQRLDTGGGGPLAQAAGLALGSYWQLDYGVRCYRGIHTVIMATIGGACWE